MRLYLIPVMGMCLSVDGLLLVAAKHLGGGDEGGGCLPVAAALGALYGGACAMPGGEMLESFCVRMLSLGAVGLIAFGICHLRCVAMYMLLSMAAAGMALGLGEKSDRFAVAFSVMLILCLLILYDRPGRGRTVPVTLRYGQRKLCVDALCDTGNLLRDPITGERVLVAGEYVAKMLLGLEQRQLADPVETVKENPVPGLRLLPFQSVGGSGFMLAVSLIGGRKGKPEKRILVAFAPGGLGMDGKYHALTGGAI